MTQKELDVKIAKLVEEIRSIEAEQLEVGTQIGEAEINIVSTQGSITRGSLDSQIRGRQDVDWRIRAEYALTSYKTEKLRLQLEAKRLKAAHHVITQQLRDLRRQQTIRAKAEELLEAMMKVLEETSITDDELEVVEKFGENWIATNIQNDAITFADLKDDEE